MSAGPLPTSVFGRTRLSLSGIAFLLGSKRPSGAVNFTLFLREAYVNVMEGGNLSHTNIQIDVLSENLAQQYLMSCNKL